MTTHVKKKVSVCDLVLRDASQSLLATRVRLDDMLPILEKMDQVGYWAVESWGGATFDSCIRYLGEDPWHRIREIKKRMPNTPQMMLFRGQNILGYRHYADDVVIRFVERAADNGIDVFRVFDAMNDPRNIETAIKAVAKIGKHAQGAISYTTSPVHTLDAWVKYAKQIESMGADSICVKDMSGLLKPQETFDLISALKENISIPIHLHSHATTGLSVASFYKAVEAGVDILDTCISSMSMTYAHSPTETIVAMLEGSSYETGLDIKLLEEIAAHFRDVRKKYAAFEGSLKGIDSRILIAQVPGGMLTNLENQLREQNSSDKFDAVLEEIPRVREDLGLIPLVTPTSQIVGTQSVINVLSGERYKTITKETSSLLRGEYGMTPAKVNSELQARVLNGEKPITHRPADDLEPELDKLTEELTALAKEKGFALADNPVDDVLTYALFPQVGLKFLENRGNPDAFEPAPNGVVVTPDTKKASPASATTSASEAAVYTVKVAGQNYVVEVSEGGDISAVAPVTAPVAPTVPAAAPTTGGEALSAPLAGSIIKVCVNVGDVVNEGDLIVLLEAMKMETDVRAKESGTVTAVHVKPNDSVNVGDSLVSIA
jgi:oxaloacetate decarboxylase alpha subunit